MESGLSKVRLRDVASALACHAVLCHEMPRNALGRRDPSKNTVSWTQFDSLGLVVHKKVRARNGLSSGHQCGCHHLAVVDVLYVSKGTCLMVQHVYEYAEICRRSASPWSQQSVRRNRHSQRPSALSRDIQAIFVSTEVAPWSKAGGLGDVLDALPVALAKRGLAVMTVAPAYEAYTDTKDCGISIPVTVARDDCCESSGSGLAEGTSSLHSAQIRIRVSKGVLRAFVTHPFFSVPGTNIYSAYTAEGEARDVPAAMDVLCQAAMAASCLLWHYPALLTGWVGGPLVPNRQVDKHGPSVLLPQTIFIANDWPTGLLPLQLLALQRKRSASAPLNDSPVQQAHSSALALIASPAVGAGTADPAGDSHLHSDVAVPVQLAAFHRLNQLPDATPDDPEWQDAHCTLQAILQDSLVSAKAVMCIHNIAYQGVFSGESAESHHLPPYLFDYMDPSVEELPHFPDPPAPDGDQGEDDELERGSGATEDPPHPAASVRPMHGSAWQEVGVALEQRAAAGTFVDAGEHVATWPQAAALPDTPGPSGSVGGGVHNDDSVHAALNSSQHNSALTGQTLVDDGGLQRNAGEAQDVLLLSRTEAMLWRHCWRKGRTADHRSSQLRTVSLSALALVSWHALLGEPDHSDAIVMQREKLAEGAKSVHRAQHTTDSSDHDAFNFDDDDNSEGEEQATAGLLQHHAHLSLRSERARLGQRQSGAPSHDVSATRGVSRTAHGVSAASLQAEVAAPGVDSKASRAGQGAAAGAQLRSHPAHQHANAQDHRRNSSKVQQQASGTGARVVSSTGGVHHARAVLPDTARDQTALHATSQTAQHPGEKSAADISADERVWGLFGRSGSRPVQHDGKRVLSVHGGGERDQNGTGAGDESVEPHTDSAAAGHTVPGQPAHQQVVASHPLSSQGRAQSVQAGSANGGTVQLHGSQHVPSAVDVSGQAEEVATVATDRGVAGGGAVQHRHSGCLGSQPLQAWEALCPRSADSERLKEAEKPRKKGPLRRVVNWLLGGLRSAAALVTVSPAYAREIQTDSNQAMGLLPTLSDKRVHGIINGLNTKTWNPETDHLLARHMRFTPSTCAKGKAAAKLWLQGRLDLPQDSEVPMVAFIGRLTEQKGVDVLLKALYAAAGPEALAASSLARSLPPRGDGQHQKAQLRPARASQREFQTVLIGTGETHLENELRYLSRTLPGRAAGFVGFEERFAHRLLAAADILVVPSRFEPCGLVALSALRYGAVPVVASTGGLRDIVSGRFLLGTSPSQGAESGPPVPEKPVAHAFGYEAGEIAISTEAPDVEASVQRLLAALLRAVAEVGTARFRRMQQAGMNADVSWEAPAASWHEVLLETAHENDAVSSLDE